MHYEFLNFFISILSWSEESFSNASAIIYSVLNLGFSPPFFPPSPLKIVKFKCLKNFLNKFSGAKSENKLQRHSVAIDGGRLSYQIEGWVKIFFFSFLYFSYTKLKKIQNRRVEWHFGSLNKRRLRTRINFFFFILKRNSKVEKKKKKIN